MTDYSSVIEVLRECADCICKEHCPFYYERKNTVKCMTKLMDVAAKALEMASEELKEKK